MTAVSSGCWSVASVARGSGMVASVAWGRGRVASKARGWGSVASKSWGRGMVASKAWRSGRVVACARLSTDGSRRDRPRWRGGRRARRAALRAGLQFALDPGHSSGTRFVRIEHEIRMDIGGKVFRCRASAFALAHDLLGGTPRLAKPLGHGRSESECAAGQRQNNEDAELHGGEDVERTQPGERGCWKDNRDAVLTERRRVSGSCELLISANGDRCVAVRMVAELYSRVSAQ